MIKVNYEEFRNYFAKNAKKSLGITIVLFLLFSLSVVLFSLYINYLNKDIILPLGIVSSLVLFFLFCISLFCFYFPFKRNIKHIDHIRYGEKTKSKGIISSIGKVVSLPSFGKGKEVTLKDNKDTWVVYFDANYEDFPFSIGEEVTLITSNSFIVAYEKN